MNGMDTLRILIVAPDPLARGGLAALLDGAKGVSVAGQLAVSDATLDAIEAMSPDVMLWDLGWNGADVVEALTDVVESRVPVLVLAADEGDAALAWRAGARSMLPRDASLETIVRAAAAAATGLVASDERLLMYAVTAPAEAAGQSGVPVLTARESEVMRLLGRGVSNKTIAFELGISEHTVKFHVNSIMSKLGAQSRTEAVVLATRTGLLLL